MRATFLTLQRGNVQLDSRIVNVHENHRCIGHWGAIPLRPSESLIRKMSELYKVSHGQ